MIETFKHKGLRELFVESKTARLPAERLKKIKLILAAIHAAQDLKDLNIPTFRLHKLKAPPYIGFYSIDVSGNYRIVFRWEEGKVFDVDYLDTH
jgi:proteic killer suppression protein